MKLFSNYVIVIILFISIVQPMNAMAIDVENNNNDKNNINNFVDPGVNNLVEVFPVSSGFA